MTSEELLRRVGAHICAHGAWPLYQGLDIELVDQDGVEPLLARLGAELGVTGGGRDARVFIKRARDYARYAPCGAADLEIVAMVAPLFAESARRGPDAPGRIPQVTAEAIRHHAGLPVAVLGRVFIALEEYAQVLVAGGTRGEDPLQWSFGASEAAPYFAGVRTWSAFEEASIRVASVQHLRALREGSAHPHESFSPSEAVEISRILDEIMARLEKLETATEEELRDLRQEVEEIKEEIRSRSKRQATRSVMGFSFRAVKLGLKAHELYGIIEKVAGKLLPPG